MIVKPYYDAHERKPSNFLLWLIGVYFATYGFAEQRFDRRKNFYDSQFNSLSTLISSDNSESTLQTLLLLQQVNIPIEPKFKNPISILNSFGDEIHYQDLQEKIDLVLNAWIDIKEEIVLSNVNSKGIFLNKEKRLFVFRDSNIDLLEILARHDSLIEQDLLLHNSQIGVLEIDQNLFGFSSIGNSKIITFITENSILDHTAITKSLSIDTIKVFNTLFNSCDFTNYDGIVKSFHSFILSTDTTMNFFLNCKFDSTSFESFSKIQNSEFVNCTIGNKYFSTSNFSEDQLLRWMWRIKAPSNVSDFAQKFIQNRDYSNFIKSAPFDSSILKAMKYLSERDKEALAN